MFESIGTVLYEPCCNIVARLWEMKILHIVSSTILKSYKDQHIHIFMNGVNIAQPATVQDTEDWWRWAFSIKESPTGNTPFRIGGGPYLNRSQTKPVLCLACTAATGGRDLLPRRLSANFFGKPSALIAVFVAAGLSDSPNENYQSLLQKAKKELNGEPEVPPERQLFLDDQQVDVDQKFYLESPKPFDVDVADPNSFEAPTGARKAVSVGYWVKLTAPIRIMRFGGRGGQISDLNKEKFETEVTYFVE
jgi:hypothetical protein